MIGAVPAVDVDDAPTQPARTVRRCPAPGTILFVALAVLGVLVAEGGARDVSRTSASRGAELSVPVSLAPFVDRMRGAPERGVDDDRRAALASGVIFGRAEDIDAEDERRFLRAGLWHLVAASGQNVALVAALCVWSALLAGGTRLHGVLLAVVAIPTYVLVVGGGPSIVRAGVMGELGLLAWLAGRLRDPWHGVAVAAAGLVWFAPGTHRSLGFQLSFVCVAALLVWCGPVTRWLEERRLPGWLAAAVAATLVCSAATAPILALRTGEAPLVGTLANLVAVPLASAILLIGLPAAVLTLVSPLVATPLWWLVATLAGFLLEVARLGSALPAASTSSRTLTLGVPLVGVALWAVRGRAAVRRRVAAVGVVLLAIMGLGEGWTARSALDSPGEAVVRVAILDVGQGDATLVQSASGTMLVDTGPPGGGVVDAARRIGVRRVDAVVLTHDSLDHRGGLTAAVSRLRPRRLLRPARAGGSWGWVRDLGPPLDDLCAGARMDLTPAVVTVLNPPCDKAVPTLTGDAHNDNSLVLLVEVGEVRMMLSADAEAPVTRRLVPEGGADVLRVGHHGSEDPQLPALLDELRPVAAVISVGAHNSYGHPRRETLQALRSAGVRYWRTDQHGTVVFESDGRSLWRRAV